MTERVSKEKERSKGKAKGCAIWGMIAIVTVAAPTLANGPNESAASRGTKKHENIKPRGSADEMASSPVEDGSRLTSPFGMRRGRRTKKPTFHAGVDFHAKKGDPVFAARSGIVDVIARDRRKRPGFRGYGNAVVVYHPDEDLWSFYAHLDTVNVNAGQIVAAGEKLGTAGNTSNGKFPGMGVHLHFEVRRRTREGRDPFPGRYRVNNVDPEKWLASHGVMYDKKGRLITGPPRVAHFAQSGRRRGATKIRGPVAVRCQQLASICSRHLHS